MTLSSRQYHQKYEYLAMEDDIEEEAVHVQLAVVVSRKHNRCRRGSTDDARCREAT